MEPTGIEGAWAFTPRIFHDGRGGFLEAFRAAEFASLGYRPRSRRSTARCPGGG